MATLERLVVELATEASEYHKGLGQAASATSSWGSKLAGIAGKAALGAMAAAGVAIAGIGVAGVKEFVGFQNSMNEVFTLLPGMTADAMGKMQADVKAFAQEFGVLPNETVPALYQAISSGIPKDNVFAFLETAQKAARAGVTDLTTTVDGLSTVVNAYGKDILSATQASDLMFTAVKMGKTTFEEMSGSIFQVVPTAAALGVGFDQVAAAMAAITLQGVPTSVAATQLRQLLVELSKAGSEASEAFVQLAGKGFQEFIGEGKTLQDALNLMAGGLTTTSSNAATAGKKTEDLRRSMDRLNDRLAVARQRQSEFNDKTAESVRLGNQQTIDQITADLAALDGELAGVSVTSSTTTTKMTDLFGSVEAGNAALMLTGSGTETFTNILGEMGNSAGATDAAFATMSGGIQASLDRLKAGWAVMLLDVGERAAPAFAGLVDMANKAMPYVGELILAMVDTGAKAVGSLKKAWDEDFGGIRSSIEKFQDDLIRMKIRYLVLWQDMKEPVAKFQRDIEPDLIRIRIRFLVMWEDIRKSLLGSAIDTDWRTFWGGVTEDFLEWARQQVEDLEGTMADLRTAAKAGMALLGGDWETFWDEFFKLEPQTLTFNGVPIYDWFNTHLLDPLRRVMETWRYLQSLRGDGEPTGIQYDTGDPTGVPSGRAGGRGMDRQAQFDVAGLELPVLPPMTQEVALDFASGRSSGFDVLGNVFNSRDMIAGLKQAGELAARMAESGAAQLATLRDGMGNQVDYARDLIASLRDTGDAANQENGVRRLEAILAQMSEAISFDFAPGVALPDALRSGESGGAVERGSGGAGQTNHFTFNISATSEAEAKSGVLAALRQAGVAFA